jgi:hypothetical protein
MRDGNSKEYFCSYDYGTSEGFISEYSGLKNKVLSLLSKNSREKSDHGGQV